MIETITLNARGMHVAVAVRPVARQEYQAYLAAVGKPLFAALSRSDAPMAPVVFVSQPDAVAYCDWLGAREGRRYRLPRMAELHELADEVTQEGISAEVWPHYRQPHPEFRGGMRPTYLCEWTQETDVLPRSGETEPDRAFGSIFYPPWVRQSGHSAHAQAFIHAAEGYSFVTFRVACEI